MSQSVSRLRVVTVSAVVSQVIADIRKGIVRPRQLQHREAGAGAHWLRDSWRQDRGRSILPVGGIQFPVESGLSSVSQMWDPGLFVGQGIDKLQRLGSFLGREEKKIKNLSLEARILDAVTTRWWCNTREQGSIPRKKGSAINESCRQVSPAQRLVLDTGSRTARSYRSWPIPSHFLTIPTSALEPMARWESL